MRKQGEETVFHWSTFKSSHSKDHENSWKASQPWDSKFKRSGPKDNCAANPDNSLSVNILNQRAGRKSYIQISHGH